jgi:UDP-N-acetylmuramoyl-tripeptide--D-alanyl-D-alanine ligase
MMSAPPAPPLVPLPRIAQWTGGDLVVGALPTDPAEREAFLRSGIHGASIDTRTLAPGDLFVPLPGARTDGHAFLAQAFQRGAAAALCARDRYGEWQGREPGPLLVVDDVTLALQRLAHRYREGWDGLLLGVTGSAGKTTTKDLVAAALATAAPTLRTEGNLNNHWGVPLTLMRLRPEHRAAVVEMGMNQPGEIAMLAALAEPGAAIITMAGSAHLERFGRPAAIAAEKASLGHALKGPGPVFAGADSPALLRALRGLKARLVTYGVAARADVRPRRVASLGAEGSRVEIEGFPPFTLSLPGEHQVANALAAVAVAREYRLDPAAVAAAIESYRPTRGRMEPRRLNGALVLVDCYNANPDSVRAALATLASMPAARRIAILGDMLELGDAAARLHRDTGAAARGCELWSVGTFAADWAAGARRARVPSRTFAGIDEVRSALREALGPGVVALVKASRGAALERVLEGLGEGD